MPTMGLTCSLGVPEEDMRPRALRDRGARSDNICKVVQLITKQ